MRSPLVDGKPVEGEAQAPSPPVVRKRPPPKRRARRPVAAPPVPETAPGPAPDEGWALVRATPWALLVLALAAAVVFATLWQGARSSNRSRAEVAATATRFVTALTNFKAETITADVARIRTFAVGDFADQVGQFFGPQAIDALRRAQAHSTGQVQAVFVESISGGTASVFAVVNESVTNTSSSTPRTETLRLDMQLIDTRDGWKVNQVNILQSPSSAPFGGPTPSP